MKKFKESKQIKRLFSLFLAFIIILTTASCAKMGDGNESATTSASATEAPAKEFLINAEFKIIRSEFITDSTLFNAMNYIQKAVRESYGYKISMSDDWYRESTGLVRNTYEILIGQTNRPESQNAYASLKHNDYMYSVNSENIITICGGSSEATLEAAKKFCEDILGYDGENANRENPLVKEGTSFIYNADYDFSSVTIGGKPIEQFVIGTRDKKHANHAIPLVTALAEYNGYNIPIKELEELSDTDNEKNIIMLGACDFDGKHFAGVNESAYLISSAKTDNTLSVMLDSTDPDVYKSLITKFVASLDVKKSGKNVEITLPADDIKGYTFEGSIPSWTLKSEDKSTVYDGVTYIHQKYTDENNKPYQAYILKIDPTKAYLYMGSSGDGYDASYDSSKRQNVLSHINAAAANGVVSVAGINADFFDMSGNYHPRGLAVKEGISITTGTGSRPWCGFTNDGKLVIGESAEYSLYKGKLQTAVGGSHIIVKNGAPANIDMGTEFSDTAHPRTLAGVCEDGTIILVVVDGRQSSVSNGAPLARCAILMMELGANDAINLDGGGSSCMLIKQGSTYKTVNSPSDGSLRKVYNSLLVVPK